MDKLRPVGESLRKNKHITIPVTALLLCTLIICCLLVFIRCCNCGGPGGVTVVQTGAVTPASSQITGTSSSSGAVEGASTTLASSAAQVTPRVSDISQQRPTAQNNSSSTNQGSQTPTTPTKTQPTTPTQPAQSAKSCNEVINKPGGTLTVVHNAETKLKGNRFTVTISTPDATPLGWVYITPSGNFLASPATFEAASSLTSFIGEYKGGFDPATATLPASSYGTITITARCGSATWTGSVGLF